MTSKQAVYVSQASNGELATFVLDSEQATLTATGAVALGSKVSTQSFLQKSNTLFVARSDQPHYYIESFQVDRRTAALHDRHTTRVDYGTAYLFAEPSGRYLLSASYGNNCLLVYRIDDLKQEAAEPVCVIQDVPRAHSIITTHDSKFAYASSLAGDKLLVYSLEADGQLKHIEEVAVESGFGPRHLVFSRDEKTLYVLSELNARVAAFCRNSSTGTLGSVVVSQPPSQLAQLKPGFPRPDSSDNVQLNPEDIVDLIWAADIHVTSHPPGIVVSERTSSQLLTYVFEDNHILKCVAASRGPTQPRGFNIDTTGEYLIAVGERSNKVALYRIQENGDLQLVTELTTQAGGNWVSIVPLEQ